ncbi:MAG TPA: hypothetical protein VF855_01840 [Acidimicrobiales bacterium]
MTGLAVVDTGISLDPDARRTIARFYVPGHEDVGPGDSRAAPVIERVLGLTEDEVEVALHDIVDRFTGRHADLSAMFEHHASLVAHRLGTSTVLTPARRDLLGAAFTHEYSIEGAALCNPSMVRHPRQPGNGDVAFVMSVRGIGEGHRSSIGFRTGTVSAAGAVTVDAPGPLPRSAPATPGVHHKGVLHRKLAELHDDHENAAYVLDPLPERFDDAQLRGRLAALTAGAATRRHASATVANLQLLAELSYKVDFPATSAVSERVLVPASSAERHGLEDARFVEVTDGSAARYCATYTAFDGADVSQHLVTTEDFASFAVTPMAGAAARGKGLALFPRRIGGRHVALSRADRENNSIAYSDDLLCWDTSEVLQTPRRTWEMLQLGNCGSPIETSGGWLVLTHGVGPMRTYSIGAMLLDLDEPHRVIGTSDRPIITPTNGRRDGYVPNVVYSCGALAVGDRLVIPYGVGDQTIAVATLSISDLLALLQGERHPTG